MINIYVQIMMAHYNKIVITHVLAHAESTTGEAVKNKNILDPEPGISDL